MVMRCLYPSPAFDYFSVAGIPAGADIRIVNMQGKSVMTRSVESSTAQINVAALENGLYQVLFVDEQGMAQTKKLVIMH